MPSMDSSPLTPSPNRHLFIIALSLMGLSLFSSENQNQRDSWEGNQREALDFPPAPSEHTLATSAWTLSWEQGSHTQGTQLDSKAMSDRGNGAFIWTLSSLFPEWAGRGTVHWCHCWVWGGQKSELFQAKLFSFSCLLTQKRISLTTTKIKIITMTQYY